MQQCELFIEGAFCPGTHHALKQTLFVAAGADKREKGPPVALEQLFCNFTQCGSTHAVGALCAGDKAFVEHAVALIALPAQPFEQDVIVGLGIAHDSAPSAISAPLR